MFYDFLMKKGLRCARSCTGRYPGASSIDLRSLLTSRRSNFCLSGVKDHGCGMVAIIQNLKTKTNIYIYIQEIAQESQTTKMC